MKRKPLVSFLPFRLALIVAPLIAAWPQRAHAGSASWNLNAAGVWTANASWNPNNTFPNGVADVATIRNDITAARTISLTTGTAANVTVNDLNLGDSNGTHGFTIASGVVGSTLIFGGVSPSLDIINGPVQTISAPIRFDADTALRSQTANAHVLSGGLRDNGTAVALSFSNDTNGVSRPAANVEGQFSVTTVAANFNAATTIGIDDVRVNTNFAGALGAAGSNTITITGAGQLYVSGATHVNNLILDSTGWVENVGNLGAVRVETGTISGTVTLMRDTILGNFANNTGTLSGGISGAFGITKVGGTTTAGQGVIQLSGDNSGWSGNLTVNRGTVRLVDPASQGTGTQILVDGSNVPVGTFTASQLGAQLDLAGAGGTFGTGKTLTLKSGPLAMNWRATFLNQAGSNTWDGPIVVDSAEAGGSLIQINSNAAAGTVMTINGAVTANALTYPGLLFFRGGRDGVITSATTFNMPNTDWAKTDGGKWTIQSTGNVWRDSIVADGTVELGVTDALDPTSNLVIGQGSATTGQLDLAGFNQTVGSFISNPLSSSVGHVVKNTSLTPSTLTFTTTAATDSFRGALGGNVSLVKNGSGHLTFTSTATSVAPPLWTGGSIQVNAGTFTFTGPAEMGDATTSVSLADGTTMAGEGTLGGTLSLGTATGGTLIVDGSSPAALSVNALNTAGTIQIATTSGFSSTGKTRIVNVPTAPGGAGVAAFSAAGLGLRSPSFVYDPTVPAGVDLVYTSPTLRWNGAGGAIWDLGTTASWQDGVPTTMTTVNGDGLTLDDLPAADQTIAVTGQMFPGSVTFDNSLAVKYTLTAGAGADISTPILKQNTGTVVIAYDNPSAHTATITGGTLQLGNGGTTGSLIGGFVNTAALVFDHGAGAAVTIPGIISDSGSVTKKGTGTTILTGVSTSTGAVSVEAGVLEVDRDTGNLVNPSIDVGVAGTLRYTRNDAVFAFDRVVTGPGTVEINPHSAAGSSTAHSLTLTSASPDFSGTWLLAAPVTGTYRINAPAAAAFGTGSIDVRSGAQILCAAATYTNNITLAGTGFTDASANIGALRLEGATWAGNITIDPAGARIGAHNGTGTISGNISGGPVEFNVSNYNNGYTVILTGTNTYSTTTVGGGNTQTAGVPSQRVNVGANGTTGSLGTGPVTIRGGGANAVLGFDRSDEYTLAPGQTITGEGNFTRTYIDFDTQGAGFSSGGNAITLGTPAVGGQLRVAQARAGASATFDAAITAGILHVGSVQSGTVTLNSGAIVDVGTLSVASTATTANGSALNINAGSSLTVSGVEAGIGNQTSSAGTVTQTGGTVVLGTASAACRLRLGHWPTETSNWSISGGSLTFAGPAPATTPSITGNPELPGGISAGADGTGIFTQSGAGTTVSAHFVVLDCRGAAAANATAGEDQYNLLGGTLSLTSNWGIIARHPASSKFTLDGGTIANGAPAGTAVMIDAPLTVGAAGGTLHTGDPSSSFVLTGNLVGTGATINTTGGGKITLQPNSKTVLDGTSNGSGATTIAPALAGNAAVEKIGTGTTTLAGASNYSGGTTVSEGTLTVTGSITGTTTVKSAATLAGTGNAGAIVVESGGTVSPGAGAGVGSLAAASADLQAGAIYAVEITAAATSDKLAAAGALTANGTVKVTLSGYVPVAGDIFDIADAGSTTGATTFDFTAAPLTAGLIWDTTAFGADGTIRVTTPGADPFTAWASSFSLTGGKGGDDDGDGVSNLLEFATNSDPKSAGSGARTYPAMKVLGADNALTFTVATRKNAVFAASGATQTATRDKVIYTVEASNDLTNWTTVVVTELNATDSAAVQATLTLPALGADWEWHTFRTDAGAPADATDMVRLKVAVAP